ncbi:MAG: DUF4430 domain-containing protein [Candidatus Aenigmarchaeota archaeon]|nr:DUF4430 domain-containing protein [Candidatus Aenigmarchaeota archaeon]
MRISVLSGTSLFEKVRSLYENDEAELPKFTGKKDGKNAGALSRGKKYAGRKRKKELYVDSKDSDEAEEKDYDTEFSSESSEYVKAGHKKREDRVRVEVEPSAAAQGVQFVEVAGKAVAKKAALSEARSAVNEMLSSANVRDAKYADELNSTTVPDAGFRYGRRAGLVKIEYNDPVFINNQWTYQRIFMKNNVGESNVYDFTVKKAGTSGLETQIRYDDKFQTFYFESLNGVRDGRNQTYWEVWVNGNIVEDALDKKEVKKGDVVEWRLANERESFCGGGGYEERYTRPEMRSKISVEAEAMNQMYGAGFGYGSGFITPTMPTFSISNYGFSGRPLQNI